MIKEESLIGILASYTFVVAMIGVPILFFMLHHKPEADYGVIKKINVIRINKQF